MRFDERLTIVEESEGYYDPIQGEFVDGALIKATLPCNLSRLGIDRTNQLFGQMDIRITVARLQQPYEGRIDHVYLDDENIKYQVKRQSDYRKGVFYLEGISNG